MIRRMASVVAPPYDVISKKMQDALYRKSPYNIVRLILGKIGKRDTAVDNRYTRAKRSFRSWLKSGVLVQDRERALYVYAQLYKVCGHPVERIGFLGCMALGKSTGPRVLPHENTLAAPKVDRLNLMRQVCANLSPIFVLYEDPRHAVVHLLKRACAAKKADIDVTFEGVRHKVWKVAEMPTVQRIERLMRPKDIFIADGHHRYEVACAYASEISTKELPEEAKEDAGFLLTYFVESDERMLTILPTHRVIKNMGALGEAGIIARLSEYFHITKFPASAKLLAALAKASALHAFGMCLSKSGLYLLRLKDEKAIDLLIREGSTAWKMLDVSILHRCILNQVLAVRDEDDNVEFIKDAREAIAAVRAGHFSAAFLLNPTRVAQVKRIARSGERMPKKATYFYPKPLSGLVINALY